LGMNTNPRPKTKKKRATVFPRKTRPAYGRAGMRVGLCVFAIPRTLPLVVFVRKLWS